MRFGEKLMRFSWESLTIFIFSRESHDILMSTHENFCKGLSFFLSFSLSITLSLTLSPSHPQSEPSTSAAWTYDHRWNKHDGVAGRRRPCLNPERNRSWSLWRPGSAALCCQNRTWTETPSTNKKAKKSLEVTSSLSLSLSLSLPLMILLTPYSSFVYCFFFIFSDIPSNFFLGGIPCN